MTACVVVVMAAWAVQVPGLAAAAEPTAASKIDDPRDSLRWLGIDDSRFNRMMDGRPLHVDETETLLRIVFRIDDIRLENIERWMRRKLDLAELVADATAQRGQIYYVKGRVTNVEVLHPVPEIAERYEMPAYYRCEFTLADSHQPAVVYTCRIPKAWQEGGQVDQRAAAVGFFLKLGSEEIERPTPIFAARRVAWYPDNPAGNLGFDAGLFDDIEDKTKIRSEEREAFYQMLAAVGRAKPGQLRREANARIESIKAAGDPERIRNEIEERTGANSVVPLFREPAKRRGRLVVVTAEVRKVVLIRVSDEDIRGRFGIDHYYELSVVTPDSQGNPLIFCVRDLPEGMPGGGDPQYSETVRLAGFFMKTWAYRVPPPSGTPLEQSQRKVWKKRAPLLIGNQPLWYPREDRPANTLGGAIAGGLFVVALLGVWLAIWRYGRSDKAFFRKAVARNLSMAPGTSLDDLGLDANDKPDFSALEEGKEMMNDE